VFEVLDDRAVGLDDRTATASLATNATGIERRCGEVLQAGDNAFARDSGDLCHRRDASPTRGPCMIANLEAAAGSLGLQLLIASARTDTDLEPAFANFSQQRVGAVLVGNGNYLNRHTEQLAALASVLAGGLMSYGSGIRYGYHQVGIYTGRVLKGEKPADLPVQQVTKIELTINLKTAKALGLTIPETLLATADEVIQ
jgi:putative tryptophan/tyrosine transport system substrate-binding protein